MIRRGAVALLAVVVVACASSPPVAVERADRSVGELDADVSTGFPEVDADRTPLPDEPDLPVTEAPETSLVWTDCAPFEIPDPEVLGTTRWECATLSAPIDPFGDSTIDADVQLALTRHPATGDRRGAILVNPGGPGGDGLSTAWGLRNSLSAELLRGFDIVAWDPRGVGWSTPSIDCDDDVPPGNRDFIARCADVTGPLAAFLSAPYSVADMEAIRVALGEDELNYLGYSYGSILGAMYAATHPEYVGGFVLDGATDPLTGSLDGPFTDGFPALADDGNEAALERFAEICDATDRCLFSLETATVLEDLSAQVPVLPTADFAGPPDRIDEDRYDELLADQMTYAGDWELLATALEDADRGDASAMAALIAGVPDVSDGDDADPPGETDFAEANYLIYCADLGPLITEWSFCDDMPVNVQPLEPIAPVEVAREILVIGTEYDPLTPGYHAPDFAASLGDARHIIWEGVGHTAFPGWTPCIDDAVAAQFLRRTLPPDGTRCGFLAGIDDDEELGDVLFGHGDAESAELLERRLATIGDPTCLATELNDESDRVITHVALEVTSEEATAAIADAVSVC